MPNIAKANLELEGGDQSDDDYVDDGEVDAFNELFGFGTGTGPNNLSSSGGGPGRSSSGNDLNSDKTRNRKEEQKEDEEECLDPDDIEAVLRSHGLFPSNRSSSPITSTHTPPTPAEVQRTEEESKTVTAQEEDTDKKKAVADDDQNPGEGEGENKDQDQDHNVSADNDHQAFMTPPSSIPSGGEGDADTFDSQEDDNKIKKTFSKQVPLDINETWDVSLRSFNPEYKNTCMWLEGTFYQKFKQDCLHEAHHVQCPGPCTEKERFLVCRLCHTVFCATGCFKKITKAQHGIKSKQNSEGDEKDMVPSPSKPETEPDSGFAHQPKGRNNFKKGSPLGQHPHHWVGEGNTNNLGSNNKSRYKDNYNRWSNERQGEGGGRHEFQQQNNQRHNQPRGPGQGGDNQYQQHRRQQPYHNRGPPMAPTNFAGNVSASSAPFDNPTWAQNRRSEDGLLGAPPGVLPNDQQQGHQQKGGQVRRNVSPQIPFKNIESQNQNTGGNFGGNNRNFRNQPNYTNGPQKHMDRPRTQGDEGKVCRMPPPPEEKISPFVEGAYTATFTSPQNTGFDREETRPSPINSDDENFHLRHGTNPDDNFDHQHDGNTSGGRGYNRTRNNIHANQSMHNQGAVQHQQYGKSAGYDRQQGGNRNYPQKGNQPNFRKDNKYNKNAFTTEDHGNRDRDYANGNPDDRQVKFDRITSVSSTEAEATVREVPSAFTYKKNTWKDRQAHTPQGRSGGSDTFDNSTNTTKYDNGASHASPVKNTSSNSNSASVSFHKSVKSLPTDSSVTPSSSIVHGEERKLRLIESEPDIPFGVPIQVKHINGESFYDFAVMNPGDEATIKEVGSILQNCRKVTALGLPVPGDYCIVNSSRGGGEQWNRAVVTKNLGRVGVFMMDLGIETLVDSNEIYKLPAELYNYRPLAIRVKCLNIKADNKDPDVREYFTSLVEDKIVKINITHKVPVGPSMYAGSLDVLHINKWFDVGILLQKFQVAESVPDFENNSQLGLEKLAVAEPIFSDKLSSSTNGTVQATIIHAVTLNEFYVSTKDSIKRRFKIEQNLNDQKVSSKFNKIKTMKDLTYPLFSIFDETCESQVRVKVLEVEGPTSAIVQKVDYGDIITVPISQLKQLPRELHESACVFKCSLPLKPAPKLRNKHSTPVPSFESLIDFLLGLVEKPVTLVVYSVENPNTHIVEIMLDKSATGCAHYFLKTGGAVLSHDVDLNCFKKGDK